MRCIAAERPKNKAHGASRGRKQNGDKPRRGGRALPRTLFQRRISASDALGYQHFSAAFQPQTLLGRAALQRCISAPEPATLVAEVRFASPPPDPRKPQKTTPCKFPHPPRSHPGCHWEQIRRDRCLSLTTAFPRICNRSRKRLPERMFSQ